MGKNKKRFETEMLYGINPIMQVLLAKKRCIRSLWVVEKDNPQIKEIIARASAQGIPIRRILGSEMAKFFPDREDQGVAAVADPYPYLELNAILRWRSASSVLLALDQVQDPRNLGATIRSAVAFGCGGLIIHENRCAAVSPAAVKAAAGMTEHLKIVRVVNLAAALRKIREAGFWIYGLDPAASTPIFEADLSGDVTFVLGSEEKGLRRLTATLCDALLAIPILPPCDSLNVSVAAAITLAEAARQKKEGKESGRCRI